MGRVSGKGQSVGFLLQEATPLSKMPGTQQPSQKKFQWEKQKQKTNRNLTIMQSPSHIGSCPNKSSISSDRTNVSQENSY